MLENLKTVPWEKLHHAYGSAEDTPIHLRNLASADSGLREEAFDQLSYSIVHQGSVYEAAIYAVPFLVELLQAESVQAKQNILRLLIEIAAGGSWHESHKRFTNLLDPTTEEYQQATQEEKGWISRIRTALWEYIDVFIGFLWDENDEIFGCATQLLTYFRGLDPDRVQKIAGLMSEEQREVRKADLVFLLGALDRARFMPLFEELFEQSPVELIRLAAAVNFGFGSQEFPEAMAEFVSAIVLRNDPELIAQYYTLGAAHDYWYDLARILVLADPIYPDKCAPVFIQEIEKRAFGSDSHLMAVLLMAFFRDKKMQTEAPNAVQKAAVYAVAKVAYPQPLHTYCNAVDVLRTFGLPATRAAIDGYLGFPNEENAGFAGPEKAAIAEYRKRRGEGR